MSSRIQTQQAADTGVLASVPARRVLAVITFALLTAVSAHVAVPLPGTPVPVSLQTLVVLMSGLLLGPALGASAMATYLLAGMAGLPVFVGGIGVAYLFGPTGGYLLAFPAAAAIAGAVAARAPQSGARRVLTLTVAAVVATVAVYLGGWSQLSIITGDAATALRLGVLPFLAGDVAKIAIAVLLAMRLRRPTRELL